MGTRSRIGYILPSGRIRSIYCHWDGYPEHQYPILTESYSNSDRIRELFDLGDISNLHENIGSKHDWKDKNDCINAYGRDRGEHEGTEAQISTNREEFLRLAGNTGGGWAYLWNGKKWLVFENQGSYNWKQKKTKDVWTPIKT